MSDPRHDALAREAVAPIRDGATVALGTGRAAGRAVRALAARVRDEGLRVECVATSLATETLARSLGLDPRPLAEAAGFDHLFDGADEIDASLRMIKGRGGAMVREKVAARLASGGRRVYLVQAHKVVDRLGAGAPLPIEAIEQALPLVERTLAGFGLDAPRRVDDAGAPALTDNGHPVIDAPLAGKDADLRELCRALDALPGVLGHGLFLDEADAALIEDEGGAVRLVERAR